MYYFFNEDLSEPVRKCWQLEEYFVIPPTNPFEDLAGNVSAKPTPGKGTGDMLSHFHADLTVILPQQTLGMLWSRFRTLKTYYKTILKSLDSCRSIYLSAI